MLTLEKNSVPMIEAVYDNLTTCEKTIANYFKTVDATQTNLSAQVVSQTLFVSLASLTRFAKKCGYSGYRQFIFDFQEQQLSSNYFEHTLTKSVLYDYEELLKRTYALVNERQCEKVCQLLTQCQRVYIYGMGSSGVAAQEIKLRFMRLGLVCEAITDDHMLKMNRVLLDETCLVIGISISGKTQSVIASLQEAKHAGAKTILMTSKRNDYLETVCDELVLVAVLETLEQGNIISPQFPILVMVDIFYAFYVNTHRNKTHTIFNTTLDALNIEQ